MSAKVEVEIGAKSVGLKKGLDEARRHATQFRDDLRSKLAGAIGGISAVGLGAAIKGVIDYGDQIADLSQRFGVGAESLQKWGNVAEQNGASLEEVAAGLNKLIIAQDKAIGGDADLQQHFAALGVSFEELKTLGPDELMVKIGASSMQASDMVAILGKNALALAPAMQAAADGTAEFGAVMDEHTIEMLGTASDRLKGIGNTLRVWLGASLIWVTDKIEYAAASWGAFVGSLKAPEGKFGKFGFDRNAYSESMADFMRRRQESNAPKRVAREQEGGSAARTKATAEQLAAEREKNAARERTQLEELNKLRDDATDKLEKIEGLKAAGIDTLAEELELEKLKGRIAEAADKAQREAEARMDKARDLVEQLNQLKEANAERERSDIEQLNVLKDRAIDTEEKIEALKGSGLDATAEQIELERLKAQIAEQALKIEEAEMEVSRDNVALRNEISDLNEEAAKIMQDALFDQLTTSQKIDEIQKRIADNLAEQVNANGKKEAQLKKENAELASQLTKLQQIAQQEDTNRRNKAAEDFLKTPQQRTQERQQARDMERAKRTVDARKAQREKDQNARRNGVNGAEWAPMFLRRPPEQMVPPVSLPMIPQVPSKPVENAIGGAVAGAVDMTALTQSMGRVETVLNNIEAKLEPLK